MEWNGNLVFTAPGFGELRNAVIERLSSDPTTGLVPGRIYYNTVADEYRYYNGTTTSWNIIGSSLSIGDLSDVDTVGSPTLISGMVLTYDGTKWVHTVPTSGVTNHLLLSNIGVNTHAQIDAHIATGSPLHYPMSAISISESQINDLQPYLLNINSQSINELSDVNTVGSPTLISGMVLTFDGVNWKQATPTSGVTDHLLLSNIGSNTHVQIDSHIADSTLHFTVGSIDHTAIANIGTYTHAQLDSHVVNSAVHFTQASISITESQISDLGTYEPANANIQQHIATGSPIHFTQAQISITESQIKDLQPYLLNINSESLSDLSDVASAGSPVLIPGMVLTYIGGKWRQQTPVTGVTDHTLLSNIGVNTHAQIDAHIATGSPLHYPMSAISISESQISDLQAYLLNINNESLNDLSDVVLGSPITTNNALIYNGTNWVPGTVSAGASALGDLTDVSLGSPITINSVIKWNGTNWVPASYNATDPGSGLTYLGSISGGGGTTTLGEVVGIPSSAKRLLCVMDAVETNSSASVARVYLQIGDSGTYTTIDQGDFLQTTAVSSVANDYAWVNGSGALIDRIASSTNGLFRHGHYELVKMENTNIWYISGSVVRTGGASQGSTFGYTTLSGTLDRIRATIETGLGSTFVGGNIHVYQYTGDVSSLNDLTDVTLGSPITNGNALVYNSALQIWEPGTVSAGASALGDLTDVTLGSPIALNSVIKWNGTNWVPAVDLTGGSPVVGGASYLNQLLDVSLVGSPAPAAGDYLQWNGTNWVNTQSLAGNDGMTLLGTMSTTGTTQLGEVTNIPSTVNHIRIVWGEVTCNTSSGTIHLNVQIGDSASYTTADKGTFGYLGNGTAINSSPWTTGEGAYFYPTSTADNSVPISGVTDIVRVVGTNTWVITTQIARTDPAGTNYFVLWSTGRTTLSGVLDRLRATITFTGTGTFSGGQADVYAVTAAGIPSLDDLTDVTLGSPITNGNALVYNSSLGIWEPGTVSAGASALGDLTDVLFSGSPAPTIGDYLQWNGTNWVNTQVTPGGNGLVYVGSMSTTGTATLGEVVDIPPGKNQIVCLVRNVGVNVSSGTGYVYLQAADSASYTTTDIGSTGYISSGTTTAVQWTSGNGITLEWTGNNGVSHSGIVVLDRIYGTNAWVSNGTMGRHQAAFTFTNAGLVTLSGELDRIKVYTSGATPGTFASGVVDVYVLEGGSGTTTLDDLTDVTLGSPITNGNALVYNSSLGIWEPGTVSAGASALGDLTDVTLGSPIALNSVIKWNGTNWVPAIDEVGSPLGGTGASYLNQLLDVSLTGSPAPAIGDRLQWNGTAWTNIAETYLSGGDVISLGTITGGTTGQLLGEITGLPSGLTELMLLVKGVKVNGTYRMFFNVGDASGYAANIQGSYGILEGTAQDSQDQNFAQGALFSYTLSTEYSDGLIHLVRDPSSHVWYFSGSVGTDATKRMQMFGGYIDNVVEIDRIKIVCETGNFTAGSVEVIVPSRGFNPTVLNDLIDVSLGSPINNGDALVYNSSLQIWEPGTVSSAAALGELTDVVLGSPIALNSVIKWNGTNWVPAVDEVGSPLGGSGSSYLNQLLDVSLTGSPTPLVGDYLQWNGVNWTNVQSAPVDGSSLTYLGTMNTTGGTTLGEITNIPSTFDEIIILFDTVAINAPSVTNTITFEPADSASYSGTHVGTTMSILAAVQTNTWASASSGIPNIAEIGAAASQIPITGAVRLVREYGTNRWVITGQCSRLNGTNSHLYSTNGYSSLSGPLDRIRITINGGGTGTFYTGSAVYVYGSSGSIGTLGDLTDVLFSGSPAPAIGDYLQWNGTNWINTQITPSDSVKGLTYIGTIAGGVGTTNLGEVVGIPVGVDQIACVFRSVGVDINSGTCNVYLQAGSATGSPLYSTTDAGSSTATAASSTNGMVWTSGDGIPVLFGMGTGGDEDLHSGTVYLTRIEGTDRWSVSGMLGREGGPTGSIYYSAGYTETLGVIDRLEVWTSGATPGTFVNGQVDVYILSNGSTAVLDDLLDVNLGSPLTNGDALVYNSSTQKWEASTVTAGASALGGLTDVILGSPIPTNDLLQWNGTNWENVSQSVITGSNYTYLGSMSTTGTTQLGEVTNIPPGFDEIVVVINNVAVNSVAAANVYVESGDSASYAGTHEGSNGYAGATAGADLWSAYDGAPLLYRTSTDLPYGGIIRYTRLYGTQVWSVNGTLGRLNTNAVINVIGGITTHSGEIDRIKVFTTDGTSPGTFSSGRVDVYGYQKNISALDDLTDVVLGSPITNGNALIYNSSLQIWEPGTVSAGASALGDLTDVVLGSPIDLNSFIKWDGTNWVTTPGINQLGSPYVGSGITSLGTITGGTSGQLLGELIGIPPGATEIILLVNSISLTGTNHVYFNIGDSSGYASAVSGSYGVMTGANQGTTAWSTSLGALFSFITSSETPNGQIRLVRDPNSHVWFIYGGIAVQSTAKTEWCAGYIDNVVEIDRIKVVCDAGDFDGGSVEVCVVDGASVTTLGGLTDVDLTGSPVPQADMVLTYNGTKWVHQAATSGVTDHTLLTNIGVNTHAQIDTHIATGSPLHYPMSAISITESQISDLQPYLLNINNESLGDLSDVTLGSPIAINSVIKWNGSAWIPAIDEVGSPLGGTGASYLNQLLDVSLVGSPTPLVGDYLQWNGSAWTNIQVDPINNSGLTYIGSIDTSTGGTSAEFVGIPANIDQLVCVLSDVTLTVSSGSTGLSWLQLADSASYTTTDEGTTAYALNATTNNASLWGSGNGALLQFNLGTGASGSGHHGVITFTRIAGTNTWIASGTFSRGNTTAVANNVNGQVQLSGSADRLKIHLTGGITATWSAGQIDLYVVNNVAALDDLIDVNLGSPITDGYALTYDSATQKWVPSLVATTGGGSPIVSSLNDLTDVNLTGSPALATNDLLQYNGIEWVNGPLPTPIDLPTSSSANPPIRIEGSNTGLFGNSGSNPVIGLAVSGVYVFSSQGPSGVTHVRGTTGVSGQGGDVKIAGGISTGSAPGTDVEIISGQGTSGQVCGDVKVYGALSTSSLGGDVVLRGGAGSISSNDGKVIIAAQGIVAGRRENGLLFKENANNGNNHVELKAPSNITNSRTWTLPQDSPATATGQFLTTDASGILSFATPASGASLLDDLTDVVLGSPITTNDALIYNGTNWVSGTITAGASALNDLTDVTLGSPITNGYALAYNAITQMWEPSLVANGGSGLTYVGTISGGTGTTTLGEVTGIPANATNIVCVMRDLSITLSSGSANYYMQLGDDGTYTSSSGGSMAGMSSGVSTTLWGASTGAWLASAGSAVSGYNYSGVVEFIKEDTTQYWEVRSQMYRGTTAGAYLSSGFTSTTGTVDRIRMFTSGGSGPGTFAGGTIDVYVGFGGSGATVLDDLADVNLGSPITDGYALTYDSATQKWVPGTASGVSALSSLTDVSVAGSPALAIDDYLQWNGTAWTNVHLANGLGALKRVHLGTLNSYGSTTLGELTNIPANCKHIELVGHDLHVATATGMGVLLGDASGYASVYQGTLFVGVSPSTQATASWSSYSSTIGAIFYAQQTTTDYAYGSVHLYRLSDLGSPANNDWSVTSQFGAGAATTQFKIVNSNGHINNGTELVDRLKVVGTANWTTGSVEVYAYVPTITDTPTFGELTDINLTGSPLPTNGDVLTYNGSQWVQSASINQYIYDSTLSAGSPTAKISHTVTHNLGQKFVNITVYEDAGSPITTQQIIPSSVILNSANVLTINFDVAQDCYAVIMGNSAISPAGG